MATWKVLAEWCWMRHLGGEEITIPGFYILKNQHVIVIVFSCGTAKKTIINRDNWVTHSLCFLDSYANNWKQYFLTNHRQKMMRQLFFSWASGLGIFRKVNKEKPRIQSGILLWQWHMSRHGKNGVCAWRCMDANPITFNWTRHLSLRLHTHNCVVWLLSHKQVIWTYSGQEGHWPCSLFQLKFSSYQEMLWQKDTQSSLEL